MSESSENWDLDDDVVDKGGSSTNAPDALARIRAAMSVPKLEVSPVDTTADTGASTTKTTATTAISNTVAGFQRDSSPVPAAERAALVQDNRELDVEDWGDDFADADITLPTKNESKPIIVRGIKSTTVEEDDWADDFDFSPKDSKQLESKLKVPKTVQRNKPAMKKRAIHSPQVRSVMQMPPIIGAIVNGFPPVPTTIDSSLLNCQISHVHSDTLIRYRALKSTERTKKIKSLKNNIDEFQAKSDIRGLILALIDQALLFLADNSPAKAVTRFDRAYSEFLMGGKDITADHALHVTILYELGAASLELSDVFRARASLSQVLDIASAISASAGGDASHAFDSQGFESESESRVASPRGTTAPHTAFTMPHPPCGNTVACQAARARLLSGRHSSLTEAPAAAAGQLTHAASHRCEALRKCAKSRWMWLAECAIAMAQVAHRGYDFESARVAVTYARRAATLIGDAAMVAQADELAAGLPMPEKRTRLSRSKSTPVGVSTNVSDDSSSADRSVRALLFDHSHDDEDDDDNDRLQLPTSATRALRRSSERSSANNTLTPRSVSRDDVNDDGGDEEVLDVKSGLSSSDDSDSESSDWDAEIAGDSSSEGNWDETLGVEQRPLRLATLTTPLNKESLMKHSKTPDTNTDEDDVSRFRILRAVPHVDIVRLPKPPRLLELHTPSGLSVFHEAEFEKWLGQVAERRHIRRSPWLNRSSMPPASQSTHPIFASSASTILAQLNLAEQALAPSVASNSERSKQIAWARNLAEGLVWHASILHRLDGYRQLAYVLADNLQTTSAWQVISVYFRELSRARKSDLLLNEKLQTITLDVFLLAAKLHRPTVQSSRSELLQWKKHLLNKLPHCAIDCELTILSAGVHHGVISRDDAMLRLARAQQALQSAASVSDSDTGDAKDSASKSPATAKKPPVSVDAKQSADESQSATQKSSDSTSKPMTTAHALTLHARMLLIAYCLRAELSPLTVERLRDVLQESSNTSTSDSEGSASRRAPQSPAAASLPMEESDDTEDTSHAESLLRHSSLRVGQNDAHMQSPPTSPVMQYESETNENYEEDRESEYTETHDYDYDDGELRRTASGKLKRRVRRRVRKPVSDALRRAAQRPARPRAPSSSMSSDAGIVAGAPRRLRVRTRRRVSLPESSSSSDNSSTSNVSATHSKPKPISDKREQASKRGIAESTTVDTRSSRHDAHKRSISTPAHKQGSPSLTPPPAKRTVHGSHLDRTRAVHLPSELNVPERRAVMRQLKSVARPKKVSNEHDDIAIRRARLRASLRDVAVTPDALNDDDSRLVALYAVYSRINNSFVKAGIAYALGSLAALQGELAHARTLLVECVLILDDLPEVAPGVHPLLSELGAVALMKLGDLLLQVSSRNNVGDPSVHQKQHDSKSNGTPGINPNDHVEAQYRYAILALEGAASVYRIRNRHQRAVSLIKRMAVVARENDDPTRATRFFHQLLISYCRTSRQHEAVYVAESLATLYMDAGNFRVARGYLEGAADVLAERSASHGARLDPKVAQLRLKLARVCCKSYHFEAGIEVLEALSNEIGLPPSLKQRVGATLANAYTKKGWHVEATEKLNFLIDNARRSTQRTALRSGGPSLAHLHAQLAGCHLRAGLTAKALAAIAVALAVSPTSDLSALARYHYVRGKCLQSFCRNLAGIRFPSKLLDETLFAELLAKAAPQQLRDGNLSAHVHYFHHGTDVLQACVEAFRQAYKHYKLVNDDAHIAKTVSRIAHVYLERVFAPVAFLEQSYKDVAEFPKFDPNHRRPLDGSSDVTGSSSFENDHSNEENYDKNFEEQGSASSDDDDNQSASSVKVRARRQTVTRPPLPPFKIEFNMIEQPATLALELATSLHNVNLLITGYLNLAELRFVQNRVAAALAFWAEARDMLLVVYFDAGTRTSPAHAPVKLLRRVERLVSRAVRFLFALGLSTINKNLALVECYLNLQVEVTAAVRRVVRRSEAMGDSVDNVDANIAPAAALLTGVVNDKQASPSPRRRTSGSATGDTNSSRRASDVDETRQIVDNKASYLYHAPPSVLMSASSNLSVSGATTSRARRNASAVRTPIDHRRFMPYRSLTAIPGDASFNAPLANGDTAAAAAALLREQCGGLSLGVPANDELLAEYTWGAMYALKVNARRFTQGQLTRDGVERCNSALFGHMLKALTARAHFLAAQARAAESPVAPASTSSSGVASTRNLTRNSLDDLAVGYVPRGPPQTPSGRQRLRDAVQAAPPMLNTTKQRHNSLELNADDVNGGTTPTLFRGSSFTSTGDGFEIGKRNRSVTIAAPSTNTRSSNITNKFLLRSRATKLLRSFAYDSIPPTWHVDRTAMARLVYIIQLDNYIVFYTPETGAKRVQRLGGSARELQLLAAPLPREAMLSVRVHLMQQSNEYFELLAPADASLQQLLQFCVAAINDDDLSSMVVTPPASPIHQLTRRDSPSPARRRKKQAPVNVTSKISKVMMTNHFAQELNKLLSYAADGRSAQPSNHKSKKKNSQKVPALPQARSSPAPGRQVEGYRPPHAESAPAARRGASLTGTALSRGFKRLFQKSSKSNLSGQDTHDNDPDTQHTAATSSQPPRKAKSSVRVSDVDEQLDARRLTSLRFATQSPSGAFLPVVRAVSDVPLSTCFDKPTLLSACQDTKSDVDSLRTSEPLHLFVYVSAAPLARGNSASTAARQEHQMTLTLDSTVKDYLRESIVNTPDVDEDPKSATRIARNELARRAVRTMAHSTFAALFDVLPSERHAPAAPPAAVAAAAAIRALATSPRRGLLAFMHTENRAQFLSFIQSAPVLLVTTRSLRAFPWQQIAGRATRHFFTLHDLAASHRRGGSKSKRLSAGVTPSTSQRHNADLKPVPHFVVFHNGPTCSRTSETDDSERRRAALSSVLTDLNASSIRPEPKRGTEFLPPMHAPILTRGKKPTAGKKRFKAVTFIDIDKFAGAMAVARGDITLSNHCVSNIPSDSSVDETEDKPNSSPHLAARTARRARSAGGALASLLPLRTGVASGDGPLATMARLAAVSRDTSQSYAHTLLSNAVHFALNENIGDDLQRTLICYVMSQADLLEFNDFLVDASREHANLVLIFAPAHDLSLIVRHLSEITNDYERLLAKEKTDATRHSPFEFVQAVLSDAALGDVPLTIFNLT